MCEDMKPILRFDILEGYTSTLGTFRALRGCTLVVVGKVIGSTVATCGDDVAIAGQVSEVAQLTVKGREIVGSINVKVVVVDENT